MRPPSSLAIAGSILKQSTANMQNLINKFSIILEAANENGELFEPAYDEVVFERHRRIVLVSAVAVPPAHSQFGIDIAAILAGSQEINSTLE